MVHFLGGVFVSPAPQVAYRYLLESLSRRGYLVVARQLAQHLLDHRRREEAHHELVLLSYGEASEYQCRIAARFRLV